ncbi:MAG: GNAT family N-acetyltransferase [Nocardioidaceae bacterium]
MSDGSQPSVRVVHPTSEQIREVASLRWDWAVGNGLDAGRPRDEFVTDFVGWIQRHDDSHHCLVALGVDGEVVGFGFLALTPRVPAPHVDDRVSGDVQAVFVRPELRNLGFGSHVIDALIEYARSRGAEHVTVHSSVGAVTSYRRAGFSADPLMLSLTMGSDDR